MLKIIFHIAAAVGLYLLFSFSLFLGLQVNPSYGNIGIAVTVIVSLLYVYIVTRNT